MIPNPIIPYEPMRNAVKKTSEERSQTFDILERLSRAEFPELMGHYARGTDGIDVDSVVRALDRATADDGQAAAIEIADAVIAWMVKRDLLDTDLEYRDDDIVAVLDELYATPDPEPQPEVAAEPVAWDVQEFKIWKGINAKNPVWYSRGFSCSTWAAANELMEYLQHNCPELLLRIAPAQHSPAGAKPGSNNDLVARLVNYRPINEWGDPVHHTICDEAAAALRSLYATPPVVEEAVKADAWQDIATAPKLHGSRFLVFEEEVGMVVADRFGDGIVAAWDQTPLWGITHWQPLPAPPARSATP